MRSFGSTSRSLLFAATAALLLATSCHAQQAPSSAKLGSPAQMQAPTEVLTDPGNLFSYDGQIGTILRFEVVGTNQGSVWGTEIYTSDSVLGAAALHSGLLGQGERGIVTVEIVEGLERFEGSESNGVTSSSYGSWPTGYSLVSVEPVAGDVILPDPGTLVSFRGQDGAVLQFEVTGSDAGSIWGDGIYSDDSPLATAAVHAGVLMPSQTGIVSVEILPGQPSYAGVARNGITSASYGSWQGSFRIVPTATGKTKTKLSG